MAHEYDTGERDLEKAGMTLSRHPSEAGVDWHLKLPSGEEVEAWEPGTSGLSPPPEIWRVIERVTAGRELLPAPPPRRLAASDEYGRFEELTRQLVTGSSSRPRQAESGAA